jgi:hypothetical protein
MLNKFTEVSYKAEYTMPFSIYLHQNNSDQPESSTTSASLTLFFKMPIELRLLIYNECNLLTLFTLMHTSSALRIEAGNAFWSHPGPWYQIDHCDKWLVWENGYAGSQLHCPDFARRIRQVEISFVRVERSIWHNIQSDPNEEMNEGYVVAKRQLLSIDEQAKEFWKAFHRNFPAARHVIITDSIVRGLQADIPMAYLALLHMCLPGLRISVTIKERNGSQTTTESYTNLLTLEPSAVKWSDCKLVKAYWKRDRIMLPPKRFSGLVGQYQSYQWNCKLVNNLYDAIRFTRLQVYEDYMFGGSQSQSISFECPDPECRAQMKMKGDWQLHARNERHDVGDRIIWYSLAKHNRFRVLKGFPDDVHAKLIKIENQCYDKVLMLAKCRLELCRLGTGKDSGKFKEELIYQLENDPLYQHYCPTLYCRVYRYWIDMIEEAVYKNEV